MTRTLSGGRRRFMHAAGALPTAGLLAPGLNVNAQALDMRDGSPWTRQAAQSTLPMQAATQPRFAYVGTSYETTNAHEDNDSPPQRAPRGIHVFAVAPAGWRQVQLMRSERPACLVLHPGERVLYAVNQIDVYQQRCTGSVEAYAIDPRDGQLSLLNRQPLSLSGTLPSHAAIAPDGRALVVALSGGGAYDVLPIGADGRLGTVSGILKETGCGPAGARQCAAHPHMVMFDPTGTRILSADLGCDRLSVFTFADARLSASARIDATPGSGPHALALHPGGRWLYVLNELDATIEYYSYDVQRGVIGRKRDRVSFAQQADANPGVAKALALHPSGHFLYAAHRRTTPDHTPADSIAVFRVNPDSGKLVAQQTWYTGLRAPRALTLAPDGTSLYALNQQNGDVVRLGIDPRSGTLAQATRVATAPAPSCLVWMA